MILLVHIGKNRYLLSQMDRQHVIIFNLIGVCQFLGPEGYCLKIVLFMCAIIFILFMCAIIFTMLVWKKNHLGMSNDLIGSSSSANHEGLLSITPARAANQRWANTKAVLSSLLCEELSPYCLSLKPHERQETITAWQVPACGHLES